MEQELRRMFEMKETAMTVPPTLSPELRNRIGRQRMVMGGLFAAATVALVIGGFAVRSAVSTDAAPVPPAEERKQEIEQMRNGRIVTSVNGMQDWTAFDQDTGSFLFEGDESVQVVRQDEIVVEFDCPPSAVCGDFAAFGPGPDEVTMPAVPPSGHIRSVQVIAFDGTVRDTLDISPVVTVTEQLEDLAWSPDGSHGAERIPPNRLLRLRPERRQAHRRMHNDLRIEDFIKDV